MTKILGSGLIIVLKQSWFSEVLAKRAQSRTLINGSGSDVKIAMEQQYRNYNSFRVMAGLTGRNAVAPKAHGILLGKSVNKLYDDNQPESWAPPSELAFDWTLWNVDARGGLNIYESAPPLIPFSWSREGERVYGMTHGSATHSADDNSMICFWVNSGRFAQITLPEELGTPLRFVED